MKNNPDSSARSRRSPWAWIPTLYFAQGLPYVAVMTISVIMYKRLGFSNTDIALYTGWPDLPWVIKPFWSPFVDIISTKRRWTLSMQWLMAVAFAGIAFAIPTPFCFSLTLAVFWLVGFTSATHDIAGPRFLHACAHRTPAVALRRHPLHLLPHSHRHGPGHTCHSGRKRSRHPPATSPSPGR